MTGSQIDYAAVYRQLPVPVMLLTPEFAIAEVNLAFLQTMGRTRGEVLGWDVSDASVKIRLISQQRGCATRLPRCAASWPQASLTPGSSRSTTLR
jgi:PAS domain-containing protein